MINKISDNQKKYACLVVVFLIALIFSFQCSINIFKVGETLTDSSVFRYVALIMKNGGMPYRDTFDHKGPLIYLINYLGLLFGNEKGLWVLELICLFSTFYLFYKIASKYVNKIQAVSIVLIASSLLYGYFEKGNLVEEYALPFIALSLLIFIEYFEDDTISNIKVILCGMCFGAICMLRPNMAALWIVMCIGVVIRCIKNKALNDLYKFTLLFFVGFMLCCLPFLVWLYINDSLRSFWDVYITINFMYASGMDSANINSLRVDSIMFFLSNIIVIISLLATLVTIRDNKFSILYLIYLLVNLMLICISGRKYPHYGMILVPSIIYPLAVINRNQLIHRYYKYALIGLTFFSFPNIGYQIVDMIDSYNSRNSVSIDTKILEVSNIIKNHTDENDRIIVCGNKNIYYLLSDRLACSKYSFQDNFILHSESIKKDFMNDVLSNSPKAIVAIDSAYIYHDVVDYMDYEKYHIAYDENIEGNRTLVFLRY